MAVSQSRSSAALLSVRATLLLWCASGCLPQNPIHACDYATIQQAIDLAPSGWRVQICDGVHDESVTLTKPIELYGTSPDKTVLTGGGAAAIATVRATTGPVSLRRLTLRPAAGLSATTAGVQVDSSQQVSLSELTVDFQGVVPLPPQTQSIPGAPPVYPGIIGIDLTSSGVTIQGAILRAIGPDQSFSTGVRVRGIGVVSMDHLEIDQVAGPGIESTDADVRITSSLIQRSVTDGVSVLAGNLALVDSTIASVQQDALSIGGGYLRTERLTITAPGRYGVQAAGGVADLDTTTITGAGEGIHATLGGVTAAACTISYSRTTGIHVHDSGFVIYNQGVVSGGPLGVLLDYPDAYLTLRDTRILQAQDRGLLLRDGQLAMSGGSIEKSGKQGVWAEGGSGLLDAVTVDRSGADGIVATGTADLSVTNMTITNNAGYGLSCDGGTMGTQSLVSLMACTGNFAGNATGRWRLFNGCQSMYLCIQQ